MSITAIKENYYTRNADAQIYWSALEIYSYYRVFLSLAILLISLLDLSYLLSDSRFPYALEALPVLYFVFSFINLYFVLSRRYSYTTLASIQGSADIVFLVGIITLQPSLLNSFAVLINVAIAGGAIIVSSRVALFSAALATIALFLQLIFNAMLNDQVIVAWPWYALLGISFFATAILANTLSRQVKASQAIANRNQVDLYNLERLNALIIERLHSGVIIVDNTWQIRLINQSAMAAFGCEQQPTYVCDLSNELAEKLAQWQMHQHLNAPQQRILLNNPELAVYLTPIGSSNGMATLIFLDDKSTLSERAQQMKLASLGRFTASIAHELRNPLGAIRHAAQLLEESKPRGADQRMIRIIEEQSQRMNVVIKNILHLSRRKETILEEFELSDWLHDFRERYLANHPEKIIFNIKINPERFNILFDASQLEQVLTNLCDNACRASHEKQGHYKVWLQAQFDHDADKFYLDVIDDGGGVAEADVDRLFEPFFTTQHDGHGLGLYIANELCQANFAHLTYVKTVAGACFRITFPLMVMTNVR